MLLNRIKIDGRISLRQIQSSDGTLYGNSNTFPTSISSSDNNTFYGSLNIFPNSVGSFSSAYLATLSAASRPDNVFPTSIKARFS